MCVISNWIQQTTTFNNHQVNFDDLSIIGSEVQLVIERSDNSKNIRNVSSFMNVTSFFRASSLVYEVGLYGLFQLMNESSKIPG